MASEEQSPVKEEDNVPSDSARVSLLLHDRQQIDLFSLFRSGRKPLQRSKCDTLVLAIFKICFCSLGLWGHQLWNYIPRVLVGAIVLYQAVYDFYVVLGCPGFDCGFLQNSTDKNKTSHHKDDRKIANAVYTIVTVAAVISYFLFIGCFIATRRNTYVALITLSESLDANNNDLDKKNVCCLCFAFTVITTLFLCSVAVFYAIIWKSQPRNSLSTHSRLEWVRSFSHNGQQLQLAMCLLSARLRFVSHTLKRPLPLSSPPLTLSSPLSPPGSSLSTNSKNTVVQLYPKLGSSYIVPSIPQFVHCLPGVSKLIYRSKINKWSQGLLGHLSVPARSKQTYGGPIWLLTRDCFAQVCG